MKFYELPINSKFKVDGSNKTYQKVKEKRKTCCKVQCNAKEEGQTIEIVFKPMQQVKEIKDAN